MSEKDKVKQAFGRGGVNLKKNIMAALSVP
jgi:hypothetical protein